MKRTINIGTECYGLLTCASNPEFLLPVKLMIIEKYSLGTRTNYKVKIRDIFETNFDYLKENMVQLRLSTDIKTKTGIINSTFIKKGEMDKIENKTELLTFLNDRPFFLEDNYITLDKEGLKDLYCRFVKYLINHHYTKLFELTNKSFLANTPIYENQKDIFLKRINKIGFGDLFERFDLKLDI